MVARRLTLGHVFALTTAGLALLLGALFALLLEGSRRSIIQSADTLRMSAGRRTEDRVRAHLAAAAQAVEALERDIRSGTVDPDQPRALEAALFSAVLNAPELAELTLTRAHGRGFGRDGALQLGGERERWQLSVYRVLDGDQNRLVTRRTSRQGPRWVVELRDRPPDAGLLDAPLSLSAAETASAHDPTEHATFITPASASLYGDVVWSDLHWSDLERDPAHRRVVVTVMKAIEDARGEFVGVARAGLLTQQLDQIVRLPVTGASDDPHRVFLCDEAGRLITRIDPRDRLEEQADNSLRVAPADLPSEVAAALRLPGLREVRADRPATSGQAWVGGRRSPTSLSRVCSDATSAAGSMVSGVDDR